jgi:hypothetical protein
VCCLYIEGACGINWGIEKLIRQKRSQTFRIIARIVLSKGRRKSSTQDRPRRPRGGVDK